MKFLIRILAATSIALSFSMPASAVDEILITAQPYPSGGSSSGGAGYDGTNHTSGGMTQSNWGMATCMQGAIILNQLCVEKAIELRTTNQRYCSGIGAASVAITTLGGFVVESAKSGKIKIAGGTLVGLGALVGVGSAHCFLEVSGTYDKNELSCKTTLEANTSICKMANGVGF